MWRHDAARSAASKEKLPDRLHLRWFVELGAPRPAWPSNQNKLQFDRLYEPVLKGKTRDEHDWLFWEHRGNKAARHGKWKIVSLGRGDPADLKIWELYDLEIDRTETRDLAKEHPERVADMSQAWRNWAKRTGMQRKRKKKK